MPRPVELREKIEIEGIPLRLDEVARNHPEVLMARILHGHGRTDAYWSALAKAGLNREVALDKCKGWGLDAGILGHLTE